MITDVIGHVVSIEAAFDASTRRTSFLNYKKKKLPDSRLRNKYVHDDLAKHFYTLQQKSIKLYSTEGDSRKSRILQGRDATIDQFPYQASLRKNNFHFCGGAIISEEHILTAAHCVSELEPNFEEVAVHTATKNRTSVGNVYKIADITIHPMFEANATRSVNDVAVIMVIF